MVSIQARKRWNCTQIELEKGKSYRFAASGLWRDGKYECDATGYFSADLQRFEWMRRDRGGKWFSLIGRIDRKRATQFDIGRLIERDADYVAAASGVLYCFANDVWFMYFNNIGHIDVSVIAVWPRRTQGETPRSSI